VVSSNMTQLLGTVDRATVKMEHRVGEPKVLLEKLMPGAPIDSIGSTEALNLSSLLVDFAGATTMPWKSDLAVVRALLQCCQGCVAIKCDFVHGEVELLEEALSPCLDACDHVASSLVVASAMATQVLADHRQTVVVVPADSEGGPDTMQVVPALDACFTYFSTSSPLAWGQTREVLVKAAKGLELKHPVETLDATMNFLSTTWVQSARAKGLDLVLMNVARMSKELKDKSPKFDHLITNTKYNTSLVKKQLVNAPCTVAATLVDHLSTLVASIAQVFGFSEQDVAGHPTLSEALGVVDSAKISLGVVAAVNAIEHFSKTAQGPSMAKELLDDKALAAGLPQALATKLRSLAAA